jgi:hypothetical protein
MSDLHRALRERTDDFRPERTPPIAALRARKRRRDTVRAAGATAVLVAAAVAVLPSALSDKADGALDPDRAATAPESDRQEAVGAEEIKTSFRATFGPGWQPRVENCQRDSAAGTAVAFDWERPRESCNVMFQNSSTTGVVDVRALSFAEPPTDQDLKALVPFLGSSTDAAYTILSEERPEPGTVLFVARAGGQGILVSIVRLEDGTVVTTRQPPSQSSITAASPAVTAAFLKQFLARPAG